MSLMKMRYFILIGAVIGMIVAFSLWPVVVGEDPHATCREGPPLILKDCPIPELKTTRIDYLLNSFRYDQDLLLVGFASRDQYCSISECLSEKIAIPASLVLGAAVGSAAGLAVALIVSHEHKAARRK
jgi:hypothetical protein